MSETVTVDLETYLKYKKHYESCNIEKNNIKTQLQDLYEHKIQDMYFQLEQARIQLRDQNRDFSNELEAYNKLKNGTFVDKLNFLFSKE